MIETAAASRSATPGARSIRAIEDPAMRAYCTTLARFASSLSTTQVALQESVAGAQNDAEHRERANMTRTRAIADAREAVQDGYTHASETRTAYGLREPLRDGASSALHGLVGSADLAATVTALAQRREDLRAGAGELDAWVAARDAATRRLALGGAGTTAAVMAIVMVVTAGSGLASLWSPSSLVLLLVGGAAVAITTAVIAVRRRLPTVCTGRPLAREADRAALLPYAGKVGGLGLLALVVIRAIASAL